MITVNANEQAAILAAKRFVTLSRGGAGWETLFLTATTSLYALETKRIGLFG
jgi:hypothetical protein